MKFLVEYANNSKLYGLANSAMASGHDWIWWSNDTCPAFDVFEIEKPNVFCHVNNLDRATLKCLKQYNTTELLVSETFSFDVLNLQKNTQERLDFGPLVDTIVFNEKSKAEDKYSCDIAIVCEENKDNNIVFELCENIGEHNIKIFSNSPWRVPQYMGNRNKIDIASLFNSSKFVIVSSEDDAIKVVACNKAIPICLNKHTEFGIPAFCCDDIRKIMHKPTQLLNKIKRENTYKYAFEKIEQKIREINE